MFANIGVQYISVNANTPIADIFYDMDQSPVASDAMVDDTSFGQKQLPNGQCSPEMPTK